MREFRAFVELPDGKRGVIHEEFEYMCLENYPDEVDTKYLRNLALELYPDALFVQIYELAEEISLKERKK